MVITSKQTVYSPLENHNKDVAHNQQNTKYQKFNAIVRSILWTEQDSSALPFWQWTFRAIAFSAMKCEMCFPLECHQSATVHTTVVKCVGARFWLALVPDLSNYAVFIVIHDVYHGFRSAITAYSYTDRQQMARKLWYILRLAVKCNQNDTYVKDQTIDAVQA